MPLSSRNCLGMLAFILDPDPPARSTKPTFPRSSIDDEASSEVASKDDGLRVMDWYEGAKDCAIVIWRARITAKIF